MLGYNVGKLGTDLKLDTLGSNSGSALISYEKLRTHQASVVCTGMIITTSLGYCRN